jgi:recombination protein RecT
MGNLQKQITVKSLLNSDNVKNKFRDILGKRANSYTANLAVMVNNNEALQKCDPMTVISAAVISASLNLPLDPNLGFAAIVPYGNKAQFQMMYRGFVQLAMRTGEYETIGVTEIFEGQLISENPLTSDYQFDFSVKSDRVIGYAAYFKLINGFNKTVYWSIEKIRKHGKRYSQSYANPKGRWQQDFDAMAKKTVLKELLSKWGMLSLEMEKAVISDQASFRDIEDQEPEYVDNENEEKAIEVPNPLADKVKKPQPKKPVKPEKPEKSDEQIRDEILEEEKQAEEKKTKAQLAFEKSQRVYENPYRGVAGN